MDAKSLRPTVVLIAILLLALAVALLLFGFMESAALLGSPIVRFLVAAVTFGILSVGLKQWADAAERSRQAAEHLTAEQGALRERVVQAEQEAGELRAQSERLFELRNELATTIANLFAQDVVRDAGGDPVALATNFDGTRASLPDVFRSQGPEWLQLLDREFEMETKIAARRSPDLQGWQHSTARPGEKEQPVVVASRPVEPSGRPIKILFLAANPSDTTQLRLAEEIRSIDEKLQQAAFRDRFRIAQHWAVRIGDLSGLLLRHEPDIVHFSGHGSEASEIILEDNSGQAQTVPGEALSNLFATLKDNIRCVVLNACYSEGQARAIAEHIECVVGMSQAIGDEAAIQFAAAFYQALGYGKDVMTAFQVGRGQLDLQNLAARDIPRLWSLTADPQQVTFLA